MPTSLASFVAAPAGIAAVITLVLTLTRASRLRKDEAVVRDSLKALHPNTKQHDVTTSVHRAIMAQLIARHLMPQWRLAWPIGALLVIFAVNVQVGYVGSRFIAENPTAGFKLVVLSTTGDWIATLVSIPVAIAFFPFLWHSFSRSLIQRSEMALSFYQGSAVTLPPSLFEEMQENEVERNVRAILIQRHGGKPPRDAFTARDGVALVGHIWSGIGPGWFATCLGLAVGAAVPGREALGGLSYWIAALTLSLAASFMLTGWSAMSTFDAVRSNALPRSHPSTHLLSGHPRGDG